MPFHPKSFSVAAIPLAIESVSNAVVALGVPAVLVVVAVARSPVSLVSCVKKEFTFGLTELGSRST